MRVLIVGLPLFAERLQKDLAEYDPSNTYYCLNTYYDRKDRLKALFLLPRVDVVYSINGTLGKSRVFDLALKLKKKLMLTWVGTDVTKSKLLKEPNQVYLEKAEHYCEVHWIQEELKELKIDAQILNFFNFRDRKPSQPASSDRLSVLSYISKNREEYYGWSKLIPAAKQLSEIDFVIVGTDGEGLGELPENVKCLGWVEDMEPLFNQAHCTVRCVEHDGLSGFVLESLYRGKQVIYSEPLDHCLQANSSTEIQSRLHELLERKVAGDDLLNTAGSSYVETNFNRDHILSNLIAAFKR